jgi:hypothetical protein
VLPFGAPIDLPPAIESLRFERYLSSNGSDRFLRLAYYLLRPALAPSLRRTIQRAVFRSRRPNFPNWPIDCSVDDIHTVLLELAIQSLGVEEIPFIWFWPGEYSSALMMTHDVEEELGAEHCRVVMDLDQSFGVPAAFQVVPEGRYKGVRELIDEIRMRGFEVNLHDLDHDGRLYEDAGRFKQRASKINKYAEQFCANGFRAGSMHRHQPWFNLLKVEYDMSVPNVAHLEPQGGGCCTVMPYFVEDVLELPLTTVQDHALFYILKESSIDLWKQQVEVIIGHHGLISFIIHPDYVAQSNERGIYCDLLHYIAKLKDERQVWLAMPGEINRWWRQRHRMQLSRTSNGWKIEGEGSERSRVAHARIIDGQLTYWIGTKQMSVGAPSKSEEYISST